MFEFYNYWVGFRTIFYNFYFGSVQEYFIYIQLILVSIFESYDILNS